jgi:hypothetical protein
LYRTFYLLTPPSELPPLPASLRKKSASDDLAEGTPSYLPIHLYTLLQVGVTVAIFILTLTRGAPAFPVLIIALVPFRLMLMRRWWPREVLRFVDAWACREGTPEDDEDARDKSSPEEQDSNGDGLAGVISQYGRESRSRSPIIGTSAFPKPSDHGYDVADQRIWGMDHDGMNNEWVELGSRVQTDEELAHSQ